MLKPNVLLTSDSLVIEKVYSAKFLIPPSWKRSIKTNSVRNKNNNSTRKSIPKKIEIAQKLNSVHLQSLVVDPNHFRKGIATKLINKVFDSYPSTTYTVETGNSNIPAKKLYESLGFKKCKVWIAEFGIEKIKYEKNEGRISKIYRLP